MSAQEPQFDPEVRQLISSHLAAIDHALKRAGAPEAHCCAVLDDVRSQIADMIGDQQPTASEVRGLLAKMDPPESFAAGMEPPPGPADPDSVPSTTNAASALILLLGVVAPAGVLVFEMFSGFCASEFFDPIPTLWHKLLVAAVPIANGFGWAALRSGRMRSPRMLLFGNGAAIAITLAYAIVFLPVMPVALIAVLAMGMGFLPMIPLFALIGTVMARNRLKQLAGPAGRGFPAHVLWGVAAVVLALALVHGQGLLTNRALAWATADEPQMRARGLAVLRSVGSEEQLLRACYNRRTMGRGLGNATWFAADGDTAEPNEAREVYYRLTGRTYNSVPPPPALRPRTGDWVDSLEVSPQNRDDSVGAVDRNLLLAGSRMDGICDPDAGVGYVEWTLTFDNKASWSREARAQIALPPGGVVSRLTLWVNGEECEAAFARRALVRKAYEDVVTRTPRRDPVLVMTSGNDRVLMKCFPVPAGGQLKTRIGITMPLELVSRDKVEFVLPRFLDRNFALADAVTHSVWLEVAGVVEANGQVPLQVESGGGGTTRLTGQLTDAALDARPVLAARRSDEPPVRLFADPFSSATHVIQQSVNDEPVSKPARVVVVVDGSPGLKPHLGSVEAALSALPPGAMAAVIAASDLAPADAAELTTVTAASLERFRTVVRGLPCEGGEDNVPAIEKALSLLGRGEDGMLVWVHGPQPVIMKPLDALLQRAERGEQPPAVYELQVSPGRDSILPEWDRVCDIRSVPRRGEPGEDLKAFLASLDGYHKRLAWHREKRGRGPDDPQTSTTRSGGHVARLWASDEVRRGAIRATAAKENEAVALAAAYQLVTPVTGAVVLENRQMFDAAGLTPADATTVPTIPEPETWALIIVAVCVALWTLQRGRREKAPGR